MIPVLTSSQIREADAYTISHEPISSLDLMERASIAFTNKILELIKVNAEVLIFCGSGNNGGDGLVVGRLLLQQGMKVTVYHVGDWDHARPEFRANFDRLKILTKIQRFDSLDEAPEIRPDHIVVDAIFGSGLARPVEGHFAGIIEYINQSPAKIFSIDIPSGLFADKLGYRGAVIRADHTISFQTPKLAFFHPQLSRFVGRWYVVDIGLNKNFISGFSTQYFISEPKDIQLPGRYRFSHKGDAGRLLLVSGSRGKMGATTLCARAAMRAGCGLLYVHTPKCGLNVIQISVPEAMIVVDDDKGHVSQVWPEDHIDVIGMGPGLGTSDDTQRAIGELIAGAEVPLVIDADALNILAENRHLMEVLPEGSILTPHPGEFRRLVGEWQDDFEKLEKMRVFCIAYRVNMVLKGAYSAVCSQEGEVFFNPTGNPGMATAGSGDVLTGIVSAFLVQKMPAFEALRAAVYVHGLAGDLAVEEKGEISLIASDIIDHIPKAILSLRS